jgi:hypothetical protein
MYGLKGSLLTTRLGAVGIFLSLGFLLAGLAGFPPGGSGSELVFVLAAVACTAHGRQVLELVPPALANPLLVMNLQNDSRVSAFLAPISRPREERAKDRRLDLSATSGLALVLLDRPARLFCGGARWRIGQFL